MIIEATKLKKLVEKVLRTKFSERDVKMISPILMFGELAGIKSHGIIRLLADKYAVMKQNDQKPVITKKTALSVHIDMAGGSGILAGALALSKVISIAKSKNIGIVGLDNSMGSSGALSYYCKSIAKEGLIGVVMARAGASVAPFNTREKILGTNPMCYGFPKTDGVVVFDMATSAIARGAVVRASILGKTIPEDVAIDEFGKKTVDPNEALKGAILSFGSYKGSGLGMVVELFAGLWTGSDFADLGVGKGWGNLFMAFDPKLLFDDLDEFKKRVQMLIDRIKRAETTDGKPVRIPGELELAARDKALSEDKVEVDDELIKGIEEYLNNAR